MSVINRALTDIANKGENSSVGIEQAEIIPVKQSNRLAWAIGGFALSLCVGGWAVSQQEESVQATSTEVLSVPTKSEVTPKVVSIGKETPSSSPTSKVLEQTKVNLYSADTAPASKPKLKPKSQQHSKGKPTPTSVAQVSNEAKNSSVEKIATTSGTLQVEQVELTPKQLANNAIERGKKALKRTFVQL